MTIRIKQGTTRTIVISGIVDSNGVALDVTGWAVHAQVRHTPSGPLLAEWVSGTPTGSQGQATAAGTEIRLAVPPAMSSAWTWRDAKIECEVTEPGVNGRRECLLPNEQIIVEPEYVREA